MRLLLKQWRETYDLVLIDSAPIISVADSLILAQEVVRAHQTKARIVEQVGADWLSPLGRGVKRCGLLQAAWCLLLPLFLSLL